MNVIKFNKYKIYGGYHWRWYGKRHIYTKHVNFLKRWVKEKDIIDIGAGDGLITNLLGIKGIEINSWGIRAARRKNVIIDEGSVYNLPYKNKQFECALLSDTVEHFEDVNKALKEIRRVIKKYLYVNIPYNEKFIEPDHYNSWTAEQFIIDVSKNGFILEGQPIFKNRRYYFKFKKV